MKLTNRSYFKRALVVFMAIVMVFTMMPNTMGVETAWADASVITTAEGFAAMDANGNYVLGGDITISQPYSKEFSGKFDGDGHTVTLNGTTNGVFESTATSAVIQNLAVEGTVSGGQYISGIVGKNAGTIKNCKNAANVTSTGRYVGGIAGKTTGSISECYNIGMITSTYTGSRGHIGGIAGDSSSKIENCYNAGQLGVGELGNCGAIVGWHNGETINNCYYLDSSYEKGGNVYKSDNLNAIISKTADEMKSAEFAKALGNAFMPKADDYPALTWETPTASVSFNITPANAILSVNGATYTGSCNVPLPAGAHDYTVSLDGYAAQSETVTVTENGGVLTAVPTSVEVTLEKDSEQWTDVRFAVTPDTATFELKDGETTVQPSEGEKFT